MAAQTIDPLDEFEKATGGVASLPVEPAAPKQPIAKLGYSHEAMINLLVAKQGKISQNELAEIFGYSPSWISQVMSSDAFQARLAERTTQLVDPSIREEVERSLQQVMKASLEILQEKLRQPKVSDQLVISSLNVASKALGFGAREATVATQVNVDVHLEDLGGRLVNLLQRKKTEVSSHIELLTQES